MSFESEKTVKFVIDGDDSQTLSDVCELARRYINCSKNSPTQSIAEFTSEEIRKVDTFITKVFDA
jgi:hypothetical protein